MKLSRSLLPLLPCAVLFAQTSDLFDKAPPEIDEALRSRVMVLYSAYISGKYHEALKVVAEDALDDFMGASKDIYKSCEISKINYSDNFTKAVVVTACKGEYRWHGNHMPVTIPTTSTWKTTDGQWFWYHIHESEVQTPWGISKTLPENSGPSQMPAIPPDPDRLAREILSKVSIDKQKIELKGSELSKGEVHITNEMPGPITISVDRLSLDGMKVKIDPAEVPAGGKATITFAYDPNDPSINCNACMAKVHLPDLTASVHIAPTARVFPVKISFTSNVPAAKPYDLPKK